MAVMSAAVIVEPGRVELTDVPIPELAPDDVLVRVDGCGICGSDLAVWEGRDWFEYPLAPGRPGHEAWGTVEAVGPNVTSLMQGQRVTGLTYSGFAEFDLAKADALAGLPDALTGPFPGEAIGCALNIFERSGIEAGDTVAIVGIGFLGAMLTQLTAARGARVLAVSRRDFALRTGVACGASAAVPLDENAVSEIADLTDGAMCDVAIEATGLQSGLDVASELVRVRGRLVIAGYHQDGPRTVNLQSWNWRGIDVVNAHERDPAVYVAGIDRAVRAVTEGLLNLEPVVTHVLPLQQLGDAFDLALERPDGFIKAVVGR